MSETISPVDQNLAVRSMLDLDNAAGHPESVAAFDQRLLDAIHDRSIHRAAMVDRRRGSHAKLIATGAAVAAAVGVLATPAVREVIKDMDAVSSESNTPVTEPGVTVTVEVPSEPSPEADTGTYTAQSGDTMWEIAEKIDANTDGIPNNQKTEDIVEQLDNLNNGTDIVVGQAVRVPAEADTNPEQPGVQL